jgi:hypothetical protein
MDKKFIFLGLLLITIVFVGAVESNLSIEITNYIDSVLEKQGIGQENIQTISEIDKSNLPKELMVSNVQNSEVGIYQVGYLEGNLEKNLFVISYTSEEIEKIPALKEFNNIQYLIFNSNSTGFMQNYVMLDSGSITGISTSADFFGVGNLKIEVYKNGKSLNFIIEIDYRGDKFDYELQSNNLDMFQAGDIISVYINPSILNIREVNTIVKLEF